MRFREVDLTSPALADRAWLTGACSEEPAVAVFLTAAEAVGGAATGIESAASADSSIAADAAAACDADNEMTCFFALPNSH